MKRYLLPLFFIICCFIGCSLPSAQTLVESSDSQSLKLWEANVMPCNLDICGNYPANIATLGLKRGIVTVYKDGRVTIELLQIQRLATQESVANKTLEVYFGSFTPSAHNMRLLGTITTDAQGDFKGGIATEGGTPFIFARGTTLSGQFVFNDPGVRSELITGFSIPGETY